jgi:hypothetical protein
MMHNADDHLPDHAWSVVELRQYTLHAGQRDVLIQLFDREFVESQEAVGMRIVGQFRDLERPNRFVWIRAFRDMPARADALARFYGGPVWKQHAEAANATMIDSDDVLLLRPVNADSAFPTQSQLRPPPAADGPWPESVVMATLCYLGAPVNDAFVEFFVDRVQPVLVQAGAQPLAWLQTEPAVNTFPALPVRTGEHVFVWFSSLANLVRYRVYTEQLGRSQVWHESVLPDLLTRLIGPPEQLHLAPTTRSLLR